MAISNHLGIEGFSIFVKELLFNRYGDITFIDDVTQLRCVCCEKVLIYNFKTNCGHHVCKTCKPVLMRNQERCPECGTLITNADENDIEAELRISQSRIHCLNKKYGCNEIVIVSELLGHLSHCENTRENSLPVEITGPRDVALLKDEIGELKNQIKLNQEQNQKQFVELTNQLKQDREKNEIQSKQIAPLLEFYNSNGGKQNYDFIGWDNNYEKKINLKSIKNVVLLGESGSGKSTLINAFDSFYKHKRFEDALAEKTTFKVPTKITFTDDNYKEIIVRCDNENSNECREPEESSTRKCKSYVIPTNDGFGIRFIDTPGFASTWGPKWDEESANHIVDYLSQYEELHAVAIVVRGNDSTLTTKFEYWFQQILTILPQSACNNVVFIFTNGNRPKSSLTALQNELITIKRKYKVIENLELCKENIFSFENEGLITIAAKHQNIIINKSDINVSKTYWKRSKVQAENLVKWLINSGSFKSEDMTNLNDVRLLLFQVYKINKQLKVKKEYEKSGQKEERLLNEAIRIACHFIINNAILCINFKKRDYKIDFNKSSSKLYKKLNNRTNFTSLFTGILNSQEKIISESYWPQFQNLRRTLVTKSIHSSQFSYLFQLPKSLK